MSTMLGWGSGGEWSNPALALGTAPPAFVFWIQGVWVPGSAHAHKLYGQVSDGTMGFFPEGGGASPCSPAVFCSAEVVRGL